MLWSLVPTDAFTTEFLVRLNVIGSRESKDCKGPRNRAFSVRLFLLEMSEVTYTHEVSPTWLPKHLNKDNHRHAKVEAEAQEVSILDQELQGTKES